MAVAVTLLAETSNPCTVLPSKLVPAIVTATVWPRTPWPGVTFVTATVPVTKAVADTAVPPGVVTLIGPLVAPAGTSTLRVVSVADCTLAAVPLNVTWLFAGVPDTNPLPWIVTTIPATPSVGSKDAMLGAAPSTANGSVIVPRPPRTSIWPGPNGASAAIMIVSVIPSKSVRTF